MENATTFIGLVFPHLAPNERERKIDSPLRSAHCRSVWDRRGSEGTIHPSDPGTFLCPLAARSLFAHKHRERPKRGEGAAKPPCPLNPLIVCPKEQFVSITRLGKKRGNRRRGRENETKRSEREKRYVRTFSGIVFAMKQTGERWLNGSISLMIAAWTF